MTEKEMFLNTWEREYHTTTKIMKAYPADKLDMKPAAKSNSARDVLWTFVKEEAVMGMALNGGIDFSQASPPAPQAAPEILAAYEKSHRELGAALTASSDADLNKAVDFPVGPGKMGKVRVMDLFWMMLSDSIHHRGQLSVYLRLVGARVPSIYGPTADEPWM